MMATSIDQKFDLIASRAVALASILNDGEWGLHTWNVARVDAMRELLQAFMKLTPTEMEAWGLYDHPEPPM
jgi:hypothetical protein